MRCAIERMGSKVEEFRRLLGLHPNCAELHAHFCMLQVIVDQFYAEDESTEDGSLAHMFALMEVSDHDPNNVAGNYNGFKDSLTTIFNALNPRTAPGSSEVTRNSRSQLTSRSGRQCC